MVCQDVQKALAGAEAPPPGAAAGVSGPGPTPEEAESSGSHSYVCQEKSNLFLWSEVHFQVIFALKMAAGPGAGIPPPDVVGAALHQAKARSKFLPSTFVTLTLSKALEVSPLSAEAVVRALKEAFRQLFSREAEKAGWFWCHFPRLGMYHLPLRWFRRWSARPRNIGTERADSCQAALKAAVSGQFNEKQWGEVCQVSQPSSSARPRSIQIDLGKKQDSHNIAVLEKSPKWLGVAMLVAFWWWTHVRLLAVNSPCFESPCSKLLKPSRSRTTKTTLHQIVWFMRALGKCWHVQWTRLSLS